MLTNTDYSSVRNELLKCRETIDRLLSVQPFDDESKANDKNEKIAVYSVTSNCFDFLRCSIKSFFYHSDLDKIYVVTDATNFPEDFPKEVIKIQIDDISNYLNPGGPNMDCDFTPMCLIRLAFHEIFPNHDEILSLDYDTIAIKDVSDIWNVNLGDRYYLAGVPENCRIKKYAYGYGSGDDFKQFTDCFYKNVVYVNAGVMLLNLRKIRDDGIGQKMIDCINSAKYSLPEQDVFNYVCQDGVYLMDQTYNACVQTGMDNIEDPKIMHYARMKKEFEKSDIKRFSLMPWKDIARRREIYWRKPISF